MNPDHTQQQSIGGLQRSEQLSLQSTVPPAEIVGYKIEKLLGQGAFGQVWLGSDLNTGRQVAIKFYLHRGGVNWSLLRSEVKHLVNMSTGRYIVQVLSVGWDAEPPYYIMEYLENGSLEDLVRAAGSLTIAQTVTMFREIADGLSFAHGKGVLHCDLKPANVVLDHDLRPRLADFGQSRMSTDQTPSLGTLFYMAPEQADMAASPDAAWDVYALGAIAYTMLVGSPPYRTPEVVETLDTANSLPERLTRYRETIRKASKPRLHYRRRGIDKGLCQIVDRCLATRPERRYQNVQQVIGAIDSWNRARTRRPLYLLGIVGPILLLVLMMLFSARTIFVAQQGALEGVKQRSLDGNHFAAKFAARTLEKEIEALFRLVEDEARDRQLPGLIEAVMDESKAELRALREPKASAELRQKFFDKPMRLKLEEYLQGRFEDLITKSGDGKGAAIFNTLFVDEPAGTNIAIAYADPDDQTEGSPIGKNYAYRSYFTGKREDAANQVPAEDLKPTRRTHLSASFRSTATGKWKLGVSAPIWAKSEYAEGRAVPPDDVEPVGVLVLTINLGDFDLLSQANDSKNDSRFAALVDARDGNERGTVLQHPLIAAMDAETMRTSLMPQMDQRQLLRLQESEGVVDYLDPAAERENGEVYAGYWIAAMQQVRLPRTRSANEPNASLGDLWVLVQERNSFVEQPLKQLESKLRWMTYTELGALLAVVLVLWFFVLRLGISSSHKSAAPPGMGSRTTGYSSTVDSDR